ncbi:GntR family transcriptional regulator [Methylobacterium sp. NEAU 140]|uniref:GntR family transcriptional regulator n=1 Tax=Methylobacterium sp. NEAU 140 TaxID=3064945 RepID=UPI002736D64E|nr:GntR family transcriptional regulator [Methylobacterium sp. NEAU 140]MDP4026865.1 GntR family transcriptional regulator [Methylobacterium sp. NEAU 140]
MQAGAQAAVLPVSRRTLHDEVVGRIRDMIIEGHLPTGSRIHEGQLGARLGISRTPLREALKFLASEGLIDLVPGRGAVVRTLTRVDVRDLLEVLTALESSAGRSACARASEAEIAGVRRLHDAMMEFYARRDRLEYYKLNQAIHSAIAALSGNAYLAQVHETIQQRLRRIRFLGNQGPEKWSAAVAEHEAMIAALEARDGEALATVLTEHLRRTWDRVIDVVEP